MRYSIMKDERKIRLAERIVRKNRKEGLVHYCMFLDFDGVINVFYQPGSKKYEEMKKKPADQFSMADPECIGRIDQLLKDYPMDVVISSSWRFGGLQSCIDYLEKGGFTQSQKVIGITETDGFRPRQIEISDYLIAHPVYSGFLILDDMPMPEFPDEMVQTHCFYGYDAVHDRFARNILKKL